MKKVLGWFWRSKISTLLLLLNVGFVIGHFVTGDNYTPFLAIMALFVVVSIVERGKLMDAMDEHIHDEDLREFFKLPDHAYRKPLPTLFGRVVSILILLGTGGVIILFFLRMFGVHSLL